ncbi:MAG: type VII secretion target [Pseudonocardiales bacterium]
MGIEADIGGVRGAGEDACALAGRLRAARSTWDRATRDAHTACGLPVAGAALRTLQDAWFTEIGAHATVLEQLCQALRDSATIYQHTDQNAAQGFSAEGFSAGADDGQ